MSRSQFPTRAVLATLVLATAATTGCSWFRRGDGLYSGSAESRPLEVPPDLDAAAAASASAPGVTTASGAQRATAAAQSVVGFSLAGSRDEVYERVGQALAAVEGVTISSRAQLLGAYDVAYGGANFLIRVSPAEGGVQVSAVDPRGLPASGDAPRRLVETLRGALAR